MGPKRSRWRSFRAKSAYPTLIKRHIAPCDAKEYALGTMKNQFLRASLRTGCACSQLRRSATMALACCALFAPRSSAQETGRKEAGLSQIRSYISAGWDTLTRSLNDCKVIVDPK